MILDTFLALLYFSVNFGQGVEMVDFGADCSRPVIAFETGHDTVDGEVVLIEAPDSLTSYYTLHSHEIPAAVGISFGTVLKLNPRVSATFLNATASHPPMGEHGITEQSWPVFWPVTGSAIPLGYVIEDAFEVVPGQWTFRLFEEDRLLYETQFELYVPDSSEASILQCGLVN